MKRTFSLYLFLASILFFLLACQQTQQFTGTPIKEDLSDVQVKLQNGDFQSIYIPGSSRFIMPTVSSKQSTATIKIVVGDADVHVKIKGKKVNSSGGNLEFVRKLNLKTGVNIIPVLIYREDESVGDRFEIEIERKVAEGSLRLTHLKCSYLGYPDKNNNREMVETDDFVDELPFNGVYKRQFATDDAVALQVGSPELDVQLVEVDGVATLPDTSVPASSEYKTYNVKLKSIDPTPVDITVYDTSKGQSETFHLLFSPLSAEQRRSTDIEGVFLTLEDGEVFDFEKLDMSSLKPYVKGTDKSNNKGNPVAIEGIFKCRELLGAAIHGVKPTLSVIAKEPGTKVELKAFWRERDHRNFYEKKKDIKFGSLSQWEHDGDKIGSDIKEDFARYDLPFVKGPDSDREFKFTPYNQMKFDLLFVVTSPDKSKIKYYEIKYNFPFGWALVSPIAPFKAMIKKENGVESHPVVVKEDAGEAGLFNVYVPLGTESVRLMADDKYCVNIATGYRKSYKDIEDFRYYLSLDDEPFFRTHTATPQEDNYREVFLNSSSGVEEHKLSIVSYQDGTLTKDGTFVDEYGKESGVSKVRTDFRFRFIKENRVIAPALSVLKIEGTETGSPSQSAIDGKIWPTISFRPSLHEYKVALLEDGVKYKLKMLKTDSNARIFVDGDEVTATEAFTQKLKSVSNRYPEVIDNLQDETVSFFSYELGSKYYENGKLKPCTITIAVKKDNSYREYSIELEPVNPTENEFTVNVVTANYGSYRSGVDIYYKEHELNKELTLDTDGKLYKGDFQLLGTTGFDGKLTSKGQLKAGKYYDIYAMGNDRDLADSMIEHYYVSGVKDELLNIVQMELMQNAGSDYKRDEHGNLVGKPIRGNCPVRLKRQANSGGVGDYRDGVYFFFRQKESSSGGVGLGGLGGSSFKLTPVNLTCGDAHIKMIDSDLKGAQTDIVTWFDVSSGNSIEPVQWGPEGVMIAFDAIPTQYSYHISMTDYNPNGQIGMEVNSTDQHESKHWNFSSGVYDLILVAYDVAGNRLERHQLVSIEHSKMMGGTQVGNESDKDGRRLKIENFKLLTLRWPRKVNIFENKREFERLFGMPWVEYTPPEGQGDKIREPSTCISLARGYLVDAFEGVSIQGCNLYRRCVDDNTPFKKVGSTVPTKALTTFAVMDTDYSLEEGKTYQYKMVMFVDEGQSVETEYLAEVKIPPSFMYFLDSIKVKGQGDHIADGTVYKYNANSKDKNIPLLKKKTYPTGTNDKDKEQIKIDYRTRLSTATLWDKDYVDELSLGINLMTRDNEAIFTSKCAIVFNDDGDEELYLYVPVAGKYIPLPTLIEKGFVKRNTSVKDLITFDKKTCMLTIKDDYLRIPMLNWVSLFDDGSFNYEAGNTYYWDVVVYGRSPYGGNVSAIEFSKNFMAKRKDDPTSKYLDEDGDSVPATICFISGNADFEGNNAVNGKCRFSVVEE